LRRATAPADIGDERRRREGFTGPFPGDDPTSDPGYKAARLISSGVLLRAGAVVMVVVVVVRDEKRSVEWLWTEAVASEDWRAVGAVLASLHGWLARFVARRLPADLRAAMGPEDVVQETYLEALRRARGFQPAGCGSLRRWLATLASHRLCDLARGQRRLKRGRRFAAIADAEGGLGLLASADRAPEERLGGREVHARVAAAMSELRPEYRDAVRLRYLCGMSMGDVASRLGRSRGAAAMVCHRAIVRLRRALGRA
jgi:RNA polymerase sigma factor (sigma-70 family)